MEWKWPACQSDADAGHLLIYNITIPVKSPHNCHLIVQLGVVFVTSLFLIYVARLDGEQA